MKSKRSKATDIPMKVKKVVWERDNQCCILCDNHNAMPNAHYISRSQGGLGIPQNVVTMCHRCHYEYDQTTKRPIIRQHIRYYLSSLYDGWNEENLVYRK